MRRNAGFFERVSLDFDSGCWNWQGAKNKRGYGEIYFRGKVWKAHRAAAVLFKGFDPSSGLDVLHHCDNASCINPKHLFFGTHKENMRDAISKGRHRSVFQKAQTECIHGHPFTPENTIISKTGKRCCRTCMRRCWAVYDAKRRPRIQ
jgi:hypothetical protein